MMCKLEKLVHLLRFSILLAVLPAKKAFIEGSTPSTPGSNDKTNLHGTGFSYVGCFDKGRLTNQHNYANWTKNTLEKCVSFCQKGSFLLAGLFSEHSCFCSNEEDCTYGRRHNDMCGLPCPGDPKSFCGGFNFTSVYYIHSNSTYDNTTCINNTTTTTEKEEDTGLPLVLLIAIVVVSVVFLSLLFGLFLIFSKDRGRRYSPRQASLRLRSRRHSPIIEHPLDSDSPHIPAVTDPPGQDIYTALNLDGAGQNSGSSCYMQPNKINKNSHRGTSSKVSESDVSYSKKIHKEMRRHPSSKYAYTFPSEPQTSGKNKKDSLTRGVGRDDMIENSLYG